jgi:predicted Na+-dependent transporter
MMILTFASRRLGFSRADEITIVFSIGFGRKS